MVIPFYQSCGAFHSGSVDATGSSSGSTTTQEELVSRGKALYAQNCASCHGPIDSTDKQGRSVGQIESAILSVSVMSSFSYFPSENITAISAALVYEAGGGGIEISENGHLQFSCIPGSISKTPLLKLVNREYINSLNQLLDGFSSNLKSDSQLRDIFNGLPNDKILDSHYNLKEQSQLVTQLSTNAFFNAAFRAGELVAQNQGGLNSYPGTNGCLSQNSLNQACHQNFVGALASRAFRRPLLAAETAALASSLWESSLSKQEQVTTTFTSIVQHPEFQYKIFNRGSDVPGREALVALSDHELASRLSFFLTGGPPDSQLRTLADSGQLVHESVLSAQVDRLLAGNGARNMVSRMFRESYGYDVYETFNYSNSFLDGVNLSGLQDAMNGELDDFFSHTVLDQNGSFLDTLTSRYSNISHQSLQSIYQTSSTGVVTLPVERAGFLNRAAMLTKRSGYRASPIKRGLKILESVLCVDVGSPPPTAPTSLPDVEGQILTTRENSETVSQASGSSCIFCHSRINPLGYAFENFDTLGRVRTEERIFDGGGNLIASHAVDTEAVTEELAETPVRTRDSVELSQEIGSSDRALLCFAKNLKRFESRTEVNSGDNCQMNQSLTSLYGEGQNQGSIKDAVKSLIFSDEFKHWSY